jgi:hypothetical protein
MTIKGHDALGVKRSLRNCAIPHVRVGRRYVIPKTAVKSWLATIGLSVMACSDRPTDVEHSPLSQTPQWVNMFPHDRRRVFSNPLFWSLDE